MRKFVGLLLICVLLVSIEAVFAQNNIVIPAPGQDPSVFPDELPVDVVYMQPQDSCRGTDASKAITSVNNPCSTFEQQPAYGEASLEAKQALVITADLPFVLRPDQKAQATKLELLFTNTSTCFPAQGNLDMFAQFKTGWSFLYPDLCSVTNVRPYVVVVVNNSSAAIPYGMVDGFGSFYGKMGVSLLSSWTADQIVAVRDLHLKKMVFKNKTAVDAWKDGNPYPHINPANCFAVKDLQTNQVTYCKGVNVVVMIWDGNSWQSDYGLYGVTPDGKKFQYMDVKPLVEALPSVKATPAG